MYFNLFVVHLVTTFLFQVLGMKIKEWTFTFENNNVFQFIRFVRFFFKSDFSGINKWIKLLTAKVLCFGIIKFNIGDKRIGINIDAMRQIARLIIFSPIKISTFHTLFDSFTATGDNNRFLYIALIQMRRLIVSSGSMLFDIQSFKFTYKLLSHE